ncbi:hypothetical protein [Oceaniglobus trochenteri]|uniref:hypothetical protein n=1 Tax=Oceaniglobus trochenteri TaxID=2763260 RepID=UPI001CFF9CDD|nr:hypothetical protein [Oceaniglobus trochenteri]
MTRYALVAALLACLGFGGAAWWQSSKVDDLQDRISAQGRANAALMAQAVQARLSAAVAAAYRESEARRASAANATIEKILTADLGECADAQLDPALSDILRGLRQAD